MLPAPSPARKNLLVAMLALLASAVLAIVLYRTAWIADDAAITLRTVLNTLHGYGPRFNLDERVQAYTHPLWFMALLATSALTQEVFNSTYALSIGMSTLAFAVLVLTLGRHWQGMLIAASAALLSQAFVDFSTSGLENPLSHLLVLAAYLAATRLPRDPAHDGPAPVRWFFVTCALAYLNRPDLVLLLAPPALWVLWQQRQHTGRLAAAVALAALPVLAWTAFSLLYYGLPWPNTAYAKLGAGIAQSERVVQGLRYLAHTLQTDPLTLAVIVTGIAAGLWRGGLDRALALGTALYLAYVVAIGGDFMAGRFLTVPFFAALAVLVQTRPTARWALLLTAGIAALGLVVPAHPTVLSGKGHHDPFIGSSGIANERGFYYRQTGLRLGLLHSPDRQAWTAPSEPRVLVVCGGMGFMSILQGAQAHLIDLCALADPLLAHLPAQTTTAWRVGHFYRALPANYIESVRSHSNLLSDAALRDTYDTVRLLTRAPLLAPGRLAAIWHASIHGLAAGVDADSYRLGAIGPSTAIGQVSLASLSEPFDPSAPFQQHRPQVFQHALEVQFHARLRFDQLELALDSTDTYTLSAWLHGHWLPLAHIPSGSRPFMDNRMVQLPDGPVTTDRLLVTGSAGDGLYAIGHLRLWLQGQPVRD